MILGALSEPAQGKERQSQKKGNYQDGGQWADFYICRETTPLLITRKSYRWSIADQQIDLLVLDGVSRSQINYNRLLRIWKASGSFQHP